VKSKKEIPLKPDVKQQELMGEEQTRSLIFNMTKRAASAALQPQPVAAAQRRRSFRPTAMAIVFALTVALMQSAQAQTYTVLHNFTGGSDGQSPAAGLTMDRAGNLYGTTYYGGGASGNGVAFKLARKGSGFVFSPLHNFGDGTDGANPVSKVTIGPDGGLYGTTVQGGANGVGVVFDVRTPPTACHTAICYWNESLPYQFTGFQQGGYPDSAPIFDENGNMFGALPGDICCGVVYQLTPSHGGWTQSVLYAFTGGSDGSVPHGGVIRDQAGNLYGVTYAGGAHNGGVVYQLVPSGSGWTENVLHSLDPATDGINPFGGLVFDQAGNLYGTTTDGGSLNGGAVFMLSHSGNSWTSTVIHSFQRTARGPLPGASLAFDAAGSLYGTTIFGGSSDVGTIFKLTPGSGGWTYTLLKDFAYDCHDGCLPYSDVIFDTSGNRYGTTAKGGTYGQGVTWEITP
jgi:uncharacterized repeat protein (TIGR03803 family)